MKKHFIILNLCSLIFLLFSCNDTFHAKQQKDNKLPSTKSIDSHSSTNKVSVGYLTFAKWTKEYTWDAIAYEDLTHIVMSFLKPASASDPRIIYSDTEENFSEYPLVEKTFFGYAKKLIAKAHQHNVKVMFALNDYDHAKQMKGIFANDILRKQFINNLIEICITYGFDGIDLDYEYPTSYGEGKKVTQFMKELHTAVNANPNINKPFNLTMAVAYGAFASRFLEFDKLSNYCDWYNVMTYDYDATWSTHAGFNAPLYPDEAAKTALRFQCTHKTMLEYYHQTLNIPLDKLVLGLPFYGYKFDNFRKLYQLKKGGKGLTYTQIHNEYLNKPDWEYKWSDSAQVPYLVNKVKKSMITYDDATSIALKCDYAKRNNFRGVMVWELSRGYLHGAHSSQPLLKIMGDKILRNIDNAEVLESGSIYKIASALNSKKVLDVANAQQTNKAKVLLWQQNVPITTNQLWKVKKTKDNYYVFNPVHAPDKALSVAGGSNKSGTLINIWDDFAMKAQKWKVIQLPNNYYSLSPACAPNKSLDLSNGFTFNGTKLQIWDSNGSNAQKFIITKE